MTVIAFLTFAHSIMHAFRLTSEWSVGCDSTLLVASIVTWINTETTREDLIALVVIALICIGSAVITAGLTLVFLMVSVRTCFACGALAVMTWLRAVRARRTQRA
jgi:hypothetical protein